jgi:CheY-like chemotaxis protein
MFSRGSTSYEGAGIGLALVRKVAQRMGGRVGVESEEGQGSRFWLELKCGETKPAPAKAVSASSEAHGGTVLYVEDEESDALFMQTAFMGKGLGAALRVAGNGRVAIDYLSGAGKYTDRQQYPSPKVVLLDLNLPEVSGFEALRWMRNHPDFAATPVVMFSSSNREDDKAKAGELGANDFLEKPSSGVKFADVVEELRRKWHI